LIVVGILKAVQSETKGL